MHRDGTVTVPTVEVVAMAALVGGGWLLWHQVAPTAGVVLLVVAFICMFAVVTVPWGPRGGRCLRSFGSPAGFDQVHPGLVGPEFDRVETVGLGIVVARGHVRGDAGEVGGRLEARPAAVGM